MSRSTRGRLAGVTERLLAICLVLLAARLDSQQGDSPNDRVTSWLSSYERTGRVDELTFSSVKALMATLDDVVPRWVGPSSAAEHDRRRRLVALVPLEMMYTRHLTMSELSPAEAVEAGARNPPQNTELMEWACAYLRREPPGEFERLWMLTSAALLELRQMPASDGPSSAALATHLRHARTRFSGDSRFRLMELLQRPEAAVVSNRPGAKPEALVRPATERGRPLSGPSGNAQIRVTLADLEKLVDDPIVGPEARAHVALIISGHRKST